MGLEKSRVSSGFGVGVLEEEDADDDDLFAQDDMRQYDRYLGESAPVFDRFAIEPVKDRKALTMRAHDDPLLPGFVKAAKPSSSINVWRIMGPQRLLIHTENRAPAGAAQRLQPAPRVQHAGPSVHATQARSDVETRRPLPHHCISC